MNLVSSYREVVSQKDGIETYNQRTELKDEIEEIILGYKDLNT
jgi:hypothetical protein